MPTATRPPIQRAATVPLRLASYIVPPARPITPKTVSLRKPTIDRRADTSARRVSRLALTANGIDHVALEIQIASAEQPVEPDRPTTSVNDEYSDHVTDSDGHVPPAKIPAVTIAQQSGIQINFAKKTIGEVTTTTRAAATRLPRHRTGICHDVRAALGNNTPTNAVIHTISFGAYGDPPKYDPNEHWKDVTDDEDRSRSVAGRRIRAPATRPPPARRSAADAASPVFAPRSGNAIAAQIHANTTIFVSRSTAGNCTTGVISPPPASLSRFRAV